MFGPIVETLTGSNCIFFNAIAGHSRFEELELMQISDKTIVF